MKRVGETAEIEVAALISSKNVPALCGSLIAVSGVVVHNSVVLVLPSSFNNKKEVSNGIGKANSSYLFLFFVSCWLVVMIDGPLGTIRIVFRTMTKPSSAKRPQSYSPDFW